MAFTWTEDLGPAQGDAALEADYRKAIIAAVNYLEELRGSTANLPSFAGGTFASALNKAATAMQIVAMKDVTVQGIARAQVLTMAVRLAELAFHTGAGDEKKAAAAIKAMLPNPVA